MALYDGFFDAEQDESTSEYDRAYQSGDFTGYFANIIGSGVCVHNNPDSFRVRLENGKAVVSPGYLFIHGYWLKNDADYSVDLPGTGTYAIVAHLNLGKRMIEIEARSVEQAYPDSLVLAIVSPTSAEDTRYNTDICGIIDTAGELSVKVEWAINYIDNEIESKLAAIEQEIYAKEQKLDAKIAEVQAVADSITPPPVGTIKFSASKNVGEEWLPCDGRFVNEKDYPELVEALGKLIPSGDKFQLISDGEIGPQISNGALYGGKMWVYSYSAWKLYGVDVKGGEPVKTIDVTSEDEHFGDFIAPSNTSPIALSIVPHTSGNGAKLFLAQVLSDGAYAAYPEMAEHFVIFQSEFTGEESKLEVSFAFKSISRKSSGLEYYDAYFDPKLSVPYVASKIISGVETYFLDCGGVMLTSSGSKHRGYGYVLWDGGESARVENIAYDPNYFPTQRIGSSQKAKGEIVFVYGNYISTSSKTNLFVESAPSGTFDTSFDISGRPTVQTIAQNKTLNVVGADKAIFAFDAKVIPFISLANNELKSANTGLSLPSSARTFVDGSAYLWGKDIYMIFVGTGIIFSRTLGDGDFGYLDTTSVMGTITQFGYLDYSQDEGTLYLLGQDTSNNVKVAKIVLNTLYDYANDGAWIPMIAADGIPAYIKAYESGGGGGGDIPDPVDIKISVTLTGMFASNADLLFNGESLISGTYTRTVSKSGTFTVGVRKKGNASYTYSAKIGGTPVVSISVSDPVGTVKTASFKVSDYIANGITLSGDT